MQNLMNSISAFYATYCRIMQYPMKPIQFQTTANELKFKVSVPDSTSRFKVMELKRVILESARANSIHVETITLSGTTFSVVFAETHKTPVIKTTHYEPALDVECEADKKAKAKFSCELLKHLIEECGYYASISNRCRHDTDVAVSVCETVMGYVIPAAQSIARKIDTQIYKIRSSGSTLYFQVFDYSTHKNRKIFSVKSSSCAPSTKDIVDGITEKFKDLSIKCFATVMSENVSKIALMPANPEQTKIAAALVEYLECNAISGTLTQQTSLLELEVYNHRL